MKGRRNEENETNLDHADAHFKDMLRGDAEFATLGVGANGTLEVSHLVLMLSEVTVAHLFAVRQSGRSERRRRD